MGMRTALAPGATFRTHCMTTCILTLSNKPTKQAYVETSRVLLFHTFLAKRECNIDNMKSILFIPSPKALMIQHYHLAICVHQYNWNQSKRIEENGDKTLQISVNCWYKRVNHTISHVKPFFEC